MAKLFGWYITRKLPKPVVTEQVVTVDREVVVLGTPRPHVFYLALDKSGLARQEWYDDRLRLYERSAHDYQNLAAYGYVRPAKPSEPRPELQAWHGQYFHSCAQAFDECVGATVNSVAGWLVGETFVTGLTCQRITVQPKPKLEKGA